MGIKVVKPVVLDETMQRAVSKLGEIKDILNEKMFTPSVLIEDREITVNGVYEAKLEPDSPADGYAKVTVNVAGGGGSVERITTSGTVISNGTYNISGGTDVIGFQAPVVVDVPNELEDVKDKTTGTIGRIMTNGTYNLSGTGGTNVIGFKDGFVVDIEGAGTYGTLSVVSNGTYTPTSPAATGYDAFDKVIVEVPQDGGLVFQSVMLKNFSIATVPTTWEIPKTVKEIPAVEHKFNESGELIYDYSYRNNLLDNQSKLTSVTLEDGHTGLTLIGAGGFDGFTSLTDVTFANGAVLQGHAFANCGMTNIPSTFTGVFKGQGVFQQNSKLVTANLSGCIADASDPNTFCCSYLFESSPLLETVTGFPVVIDVRWKNTLPYGCCQGTKISLFASQQPIEYMKSDCFAKITSTTFTSNDITNSEYKIDVITSPFLLYGWNHWGDDNPENWVFTTTMPDEDMYQSFTVKPVLYTMNGTEYSKQPEDDGFLLAYLTFNDTWKLSYMYGGLETSDTNEFIFDEDTHKYRWRASFQLPAYLGGADMYVYTDVAPIPDTEGHYSSEAKLVDADGNDYVPYAQETRFVWQYNEETSDYKLVFKCPNAMSWDIVDLQGVYAENDTDGGQFGSETLTTVTLNNLVNVPNRFFDGYKNEAWENGCSALTTVNLPDAERFGENFLNDCQAVITINIPKAKYFRGYISETSMPELRDIYINNVDVPPTIKSDYEFLPYDASNINIHVKNDTALAAFRENDKWSQMETDGRIIFVVG